MNRVIGMLSGELILVLLLDSIKLCLYGGNLIRGLRKIEYAKTKLNLPLIDFGVAD